MNDKKEIRRQAEERLKSKTVQDAATIALVHELQVHQIELEMQNDELQKINAIAEEASSKYHNLFDFAPIAYFVLSLDGHILEANLAGSKLLGVTRDVIGKMRFGQFVVMRHRVVFFDFLKQVFTADTKQSCEVQLLNNAKKEFDFILALVEAIATGKTTCIAAIVDITARKLAENKLNEMMRERKKFVDALKQEGASPKMVAVYEELFLSHYMELKA